MAPSGTKQGWLWDVVASLGLNAVPVLIRISRFTMCELCTGWSSSSFPGYHSVPSFASDELYVLPRCFAVALCFQVRDEFRTDYDADRGGFGRVVAQQMASQQMAMWQEVQAGALLGAGMLPAAAGGAVFFGQDQRQALGQHKAAQGDGQHAGAEEGGDEADSSAVINPRMAGRGRDDDDDDQEEDEEEREHRRIKRRRVGSEDGGAEEPAAASAAAGGEEEEAGGEAAGEEDTAAAGAQAGAGEDGEGVLDFQSDEDEEAAEPRKRQRVQ